MYGLKARNTAPLTVNLVITKLTISEKTDIECATHEPVVVLLQRLIISQINHSQQAVIKWAVSILWHHQRCKCTEEFQSSTQQKSFIQTNWIETIGAMSIWVYKETTSSTNHRHCKMKTRIDKHRNKTGEKDILKLYTRIRQKGKDCPIVDMSVWTRADPCL